MRGARTGRDFVYAGLITVAATVVLLPTAAAQTPDGIVCVFGDNPSPPTDCSGLPCDASVANYGEALELVQERAELLPVDSYLKVCSVEGAGVRHLEAVRVDSRAGLLGGVFEIDFGGTTLCSATSSQSPGPLPTLEWAVDGADIISNLVIDYSPTGLCADLQRAGIDVSGVGSLRLDNVHFTATKDYAIRIGGDGTAGTAGKVHWVSGSSSRSEGTLVNTQGLLQLGRVVIAGGRVGGPWGGLALLESYGPDGAFELQDSIFYGNATDSSSGEQASLIKGHVMKAHRVTFFENAAFGGESNSPQIQGAAPLLKIDLTALGYSTDEFGEFSGGGAMFQDLVFARNRALVLPTGGPPEGPVAPLLPPIGSASCAGQVIGESLRSRTSPWLGLTERDGSLIQVFPVLSSTEPGEFVLSRSTFVENAIGGGPLIYAAGGDGDSIVQFLHCTFADNGVATILAFLDLSTGDGSYELAFLRNLLLRDEHSESENQSGNLWLLSSVGLPLDHVVLSMNAHAAGTPLFIAEFTPAQSLLGPNLTFEDRLGLTENPSFAALSPCERFKRVCPGANDTTCDEWTAAGQAFACAEGTGGDYLLSPELQLTLDDGRPWPWDTDFFEVPGFPGWQEIGAAGWTCLAERGTVDAYYDEGGLLAWGDADGQPDAIDCDNEDATVLAEWPELDGYSSEECEAPEGSCFVCPVPPEPEPEPEPKTPEPDPEPEPEQEAEQVAQTAVDEGCSHTSGWGLAWSCEEGDLSLALVALFGLWGPARRQGRRRRKP